jgi:hypothetical protein
MPVFGGDRLSLCADLSKQERAAANATRATTRATTRDTFSIADFVTPDALTNEANTRGMVAALRDMRRIFDVNVYVWVGGSKTVAVAAAVCPARVADLATRSRTISVAAAGEPLTNPKNGPKSRVAE